MRYIAIVILSMVLVTTVQAYTPKMQRGNRYERGAVLAETKSTRHVAGREYRTNDGSSVHRRVLIYRQDGDFVGYSKFGRAKHDATTRHRFDR